MTESPTCPLCNRPTGTAEGQCDREDARAALHSEPSRLRADIEAEDARYVAAILRGARERWRELGFLTAAELRDLRIHRMRVMAAAVRDNAPFGTKRAAALGIAEPHTSERDRKRAERNRRS